MVAGGEAVGVAIHGVALVVVADGIGEVDGVGGVGQQRVVERYVDMSPVGLHVGLLPLRRGEDHLLRDVVHLDELIEVDTYLVGGHVGIAVNGIGPHHIRRTLVIPPTVRRTHAGTRGDDQLTHHRHHRQRQQAQCYSHYVGMGSVVVHFLRYTVISLYRYHDASLYRYHVIPLSRYTVISLINLNQFLDVLAGVG